MRLLLICILSLTLTACIDQNTADIKMAKGCEAGVNSLLQEDGREVVELKATRYANEQTEGGLHRRITIEGIEKDGWLEMDKEYSCLFAQDWGFFKSSHHALLVQIQVDETIYGKKDGNIVGGLQDFLNLTRTVDTAMGQY